MASVRESCKGKIGGQAGEFNVVGFGVAAGVVAAIQGFSGFCVIGGAVGRPRFTTVGAFKHKSPPVITTAIRYANYFP